VNPHALWRSATNSSASTVGGISAGHLLTPVCRERPRSWVTETPSETLSPGRPGSDASLGRPPSRPERACDVAKKANSQAKRVDSKPAVSRHRGRRWGFGFAPLMVTTSGMCPGHSSASPPCRPGGFAWLLARLDVVTVPTRNPTTVSTVDGSDYWGGPTPVDLCPAGP
jgi:hypothetical protein